MAIYDKLDQTAKQSQSCSAAHLVGCDNECHDVVEKSFSRPRHYVLSCGTEATQQVRSQSNQSSQAVHTFYRVFLRLRAGMRRKTKLGTALCVDLVMRVSEPTSFE